MSFREPHFQIHSDRGTLKTGRLELSLLTLTLHSSWCHASFGVGEKRVKPGGRRPVFLRRPLQLSGATMALSVQGISELKGHLWLRESVKFLPADYQVVRYLLSLV